MPKLGLEINPLKSGILAFGVKSKSIYSRKTNIIDIPLVREYKFLGVLLEGRLSIDPCLKTTRKYLQIAISKLKPYLRSCTPRIKLIFSKILLAPHTNYLRPIAETLGVKLKTQSTSSEE